MLNNFDIPRLILPVKTYEYMHYPAEIKEHDGIHGIHACSLGVWNIIRQTECAGFRADLLLTIKPLNNPAVGNDDVNFTELSDIIA